MRYEEGLFCMQIFHEAIAIVVNGALTFGGVSSVLGALEATRQALEESRELGDWEVSCRGGTLDGWTDKPPMHLSALRININLPKSTD